MRAPACARAPGPGRRRCTWLRWRAKRLAPRCCSTPGRTRAQNDEGESALHWAALSGNAATVRLLLERGADPDGFDLRGNTPLHGAADAGHLETARLLLGRARSPGAKNLEGKSARDLARERGHAPLVKLF